MKTKTTLKDFTTENLLSQPVIQEKMTRYNNRLAALNKGYNLAFERFDGGKPMDYVYRMSREIADEYEKDLNEAMKLLEDSNGTESKSSSVSRPA